MNFTVGHLWLRYFKKYLSTRLLIASQFILSYTANAKFFSYTRTLHGLELKVCGLGLGLESGYVYDVNGGMWNIDAEYIK